MAADSLPGMEAFKQEVTDVGQQEQAQFQTVIQETEKQGQKQVDMAERFAASETPFTEPTPVDHINEVMAGAPWLFALAALGGAATKMNGQAMIEGLNGLSDGLIKGDQQALENGYKKYQADFDKWATREDQKFRIYNTLAQAYGSAGDAKVRAMTAAAQMTGDHMEKRLELDDPRKLAEIHARMLESNARVQEAYAKIKSLSAGGGSGQGQALLAALNERGANLSSGGSRSKDQINRTAEKIMERHPDMSPDQVAEMIIDKQIEFKADVKETQTAAAVAGRVKVAGNEIEQFAPLVLQASANVKRGDFVPLTTLLQKKDTAISDPNLKQLKISIVSLLNAYDQLAARGGTDKEKRAEAHRLLTAADGPEALAAGIQQFRKEWQKALIAAEKAEQRNPAHATTNQNQVTDFNSLPTS